MKQGAYDRPPLRRWTDRMVTLHGDAAEPVTPTLGPRWRIAVALAKCVVREGSLEAALLKYESLRRTRTSHIQQRSLLIGRIGQWENSLFVTGRKTFFFQAEDGIRDVAVTGVQTCALPI